MTRYLFAVAARVWIMVVGYVAGLLTAAAMLQSPPPVHVWIMAILAIAGCFVEDFRRLVRRQEGN